MSLLSPNRWKFRKQRRGRNEGEASSGNYVAFGDFGMKATENTYLTNRQIEAARKVIIRRVKKLGKLWIRIFPDLPYTKKGLEMPMGKGKGDVDTFRVRIKRGKVLFEVNGVDRDTATEIFKLATYKLPVKTRTVERGEVR
ncbi:MAG: 50S ribosomal protein L16 [Candidatus Absconditabacteria bacterium]